MNFWEYLDSNGAGLFWIAIFFLYVLGSVIESIVKSSK